METNFVRAEFDIDCEWEGLPPVYRIYVNDELFTERTWTYTTQYLREILQIQAPPGKYRVRLENVGADATGNWPSLPNLAKFTIRHPGVSHGRARWLDIGLLEIQA